MEDPADAVVGLVVVCGVGSGANTHARAHAHAHECQEIRVIGTGVMSPLRVHREHEIRQDVRTRLGYRVLEACGLVLYVM